MGMRKVYLARHQTINDSQIVPFDLDVLDCISAIEVIYQATNGATSNTGHPIHKDVSKIEVLDGSDVIHSLSMPQLEALNFFERGNAPWLQLNEGPAAVQREQAVIHFGRYIGDPTMYFDPKKCKNPILRLTHALTISANAGFATGTGQVTVIAHVFDTPPPAGRGFLLSKDFYDWTTAASGDQVIQLPTDWPLRLLMLRLYLSGTAISSILSHLKLSVNEDKFIPFDLYEDDLETLQEELFKWCCVKNLLLRKDADTPETFIGSQKDLAIQALNDWDVPNIRSITADTLNIALYLLSATPTIAKDTTVRSLNLTSWGLMPHSCICVPFGDKSLPDDWFPLPTAGSTKLKVTQAGAGAAAQLILQQLRTQ
jgi:hypothetical protein